MINHPSASRFAVRLAFATSVAAAAVGTVAIAPASAKAPLTAFVSIDQLTVTGSDAADRIALLLEPGDPSVLQVDLDDDGSTDARFDRATFSTIEVLGGNGDDHIRVDQTNGAFRDETLTIRGGNGNDLLEGGDGDDLLLAGPGVDRVDGNRGLDTASLGAGDDSFRWDPGDGSDGIDGSSGFDTLEFIGVAGSDTMRLNADGDAVRFDRDQGSIRMDLRRVERLDLATLAGVDTLAIGDLTGTDLSVVDVDLSALAGGGDAAQDTVSVSGTTGDDAVDVAARDGGIEVSGLSATTRIVGSDATDRFSLATFEGDDTVAVSSQANEQMSIAVDLGTGEA